MTKRTGALLSALIGCLAMLAVPTARSQTLQVPDWQRSTTGVTGVSLALDSGDAAYVLGVTPSTTFDAGVGTLYLSRYSPDGVLLWSQTWFPTGYAGARPVSVIADSAGNAIVIGAYSDYNYPLSTLGGSSAGSAPIGVFDGGWMVRKYAPAGTLLWSRTFLRVSSKGLRGVTDAAGDVYVLGTGTTGYFATEKFSGSTGATLWTRNSIALIGGETPGDIRLTASGQVVVAGAGNYGLSMYAYDAATGATTWSARHAAAAGSYAPGVAVSPQGDVIFTGSAGGAIYVAAHDANFNPLFANSYPQGSAGRRAAVDGLGNILVAGVGGSPTDWVTLVLDSTGNLAQAPRVVDQHASANEAPREIAHWDDGTLFVTGASGPGPDGDPAATIAATAYYRPDGSMAWWAANPATSAGVDIEGASDGSVYVLGDTAQTLMHYPLVANQPPVGSLKLAAPPAAPAPLTAYLDASDSRDPDGSIASYQWSFGDGASATTSGATTAHTYAAAGSYTVTMTPVDNLGMSGSSASLTVTVAAPTVPTALSFAPSTVKGGSAVTGTVTVSTTAGGVVNLASSRSLVSVPSSVTIVPGSRSASFRAQTSRVNATTPVTITATANGRTVSATLTLKR